MGRMYVYMESEYRNPNWKGVCLYMYVQWYRRTPEKQGWVEWENRIYQEKQELEREISKKDRDSCDSFSVFLLIYLRDPAIFPYNMYIRMPFRLSVESFIAQTHTQTQTHRRQEKVFSRGTRIRYARTQWKLGGPQRREQPAIFFFRLSTVNAVYKEKGEERVSFFFTWHN